jgi:hypothetical protein
MRTLDWGAGSCSNQRTEAVACLDVLQVVWHLRILVCVVRRERSLLSCKLSQPFTSATLRSLPIQLYVCSRLRSGVWSVNQVVVAECCA